jgi:inner membrane protein
LPDWIGWLATAVFASSYFCKQPMTLRRVQGVAACMWAVYGALIESLPLVVANLIVATIAIWSSVRQPAAPPPS